MHKDIFRIAVPNIISNISVPLMGIISTAIIGNWSGSTEAIGSLAVGVSIFNFIYWNCSFVRMGTSGLTAQAFGADDKGETTAMLVRAVAVSLLLGVFILLFQRPLGELSLWLMNGDKLVADYFYARVWAVPAGILLFGLYGWLTGMQNATIPMATSIVVNALHIAASYLLVFRFDMGIVGIAYASVVAQWVGLLLCTLLIIVFFRRKLQQIRLREALRLGAMRSFFKINGDIMVRTFCVCSVYTFFTAASARMGDNTILAVNTILMQLLMLFSYMNDGFTYAAEALTGRFIGARDKSSLRRCLQLCTLWTFVTAAISIGLYVGFWREIFTMFMTSGSQAELSHMLDVAGKYIGWIIAIPLFAALPFMFDGVMAGATLTRTMRNSMLGATVAFFAIYYALQPAMGNDALWLAFTLYIVLRFILQYLMSHRFNDVFAKADRD